MVETRASSVANRSQKTAATTMPDTQSPQPAEVADALITLEDLLKSGQESDEILTWAQQNPETSIRALCRQVVAATHDSLAYRQEADGLQDELEATKRRHQQQVEFLRGELHAAARQSTPPPPATAPKSAKFPDPEVFSHGDYDKWEHFEVHLRNKLRFNASSYPTDEDKKGYLLTRLGGEALDLALPVADDDSHTYDDVIEVLKNRFADPHAEMTARLKYQKLYMGRMEFAEFVGKFQKYAKQAGISERQQIEDLRQKVTSSLRTGVAGNVFTRVNDFVKHLQLLSRHLSESQTIQDNANSRRNAARNTSFPAATSTSDNRPRTTTPAPGGSAAASKVLFNCLNCNEPGHMYRACPKPQVPDLQKRVSDMLERRYQSRTAAAISELGSPDDSGNEQPLAKDP